MSDSPFMDLRNPRYRSWLWGFFWGTILAFVVVYWEPPLWVSFALVVVGTIGWVGAGWQLWRTRKPKAEDRLTEGTKRIVLEIKLADPTVDGVAVWHAVRDHLPDGVLVTDVVLWLDADEYRRRR